MSLLEPIFEFLRTQFNETRGWPSSPSPVAPPIPEPIVLPKHTALAELLDTTTVFSLLGVLAILGTAYAVSLSALPKSIATRYRVLFIWHAFDFLIHSIFEGSFLYNCFFASAPFDAGIHHPAAVNNFLGNSARVYGSRYADNWASKLWMVYAKADKRWAEADTTVVSLELLTVLGAGPLAAWVCWALAKRDWRVSFWMIVLATGELYGGIL